VVYILLIVLVLFSSLIGKGYIVELSILISLVGLVEIIKVGISSERYWYMILALVVYWLVATLFIDMATRVTKTYFISIYFFVLTFDAFSQISGQLFGKRMITSISPNKTWEGLIGGVVITVGSAFLVNWRTTDEWIVNINPLTFGLILSGACFFGDLLASWYKRICNVKDYSSFLPGHGGVLDRYDSLITTGFVFYLVNLFLSSL